MFPQKSDYISREILPNERRWRAHIEGAHYSLADIMFELKVIIGRFDLQKYIFDGPSIMGEDGGREFVSIVCSRRIIRILSRATGIRSFTGLHDPKITGYNEEG